MSHGRAGVLTTASSNIPIGGIGSASVVKVRYLVDHYCLGTNQSNWTHDQLVAFQPELWVISHDTDLSQSNTADVVYIIVGANSSSVQINIIDLAQLWLDAMSVPGFSSLDWQNYTSTTWTVTALEHNVNPSHGTDDPQDLVTVEVSATSCINPNFTISHVRQPAAVPAQ